MPFSTVFLRVIVVMMVAFLSSCDNNDVKAKSDNSPASISREDTAMPPESTTVATPGYESETTHQVAINDSPGVKATIRKGEIKLIDTIQTDK